MAFTQLMEDTYDPASPVRAGDTATYRADPVGGTVELWGD